MRIDITLPRGWEELTQEQLRFMLETMALATASKSDAAATEVEVRCLMHWGGLRLICRYGDGWLVRHSEEEGKLTAEQIAAAKGHLGWIREIPAYPVRLDTVDGAAAVEADLSAGFPLDSWLTCETLWQAYQLTEDEAQLKEMAATLYGRKGLRLTPGETIGVFYWWAAVKRMVADMFPHFFKPAGEGDQPSADDIRRGVDSQIRALTKGDITKEKDVLAMETMRALTELDALAREYDEMKAQCAVKN